MSTLSYANTAYAAREAAGPASGRKPVWRRVFEAIVRAQERRAEREIAAYLASHGGLMTDDMERQIMNRLQGRHGPAL
jgi:hypothetical protein